MRVHKLSPEVKINYISICVLVAYLVLPVLNRGLPAFVRVAYVCVALFTYYVSLCLIDRSGWIETTVVILLALLFVSLCYFGSRQTVSLPNYVFANFLFWIPFLFMYNRCLVRDDSFRRFLSRFILVLFIVTATTTLFGLIQDPMVSRFLATGQTDGYGLRGYSFRNVGDYNFIYSLVIMLPMLIGAWRLTGIKHGQLLIALLLSLVCLVRAQYSIALIVSFIALSMALLVKRFSPMKLCLIVIVEFMLLLALYAFLPSIIDLVSNLGPSASFIRYRLSDTLAVINSDSIFGLDRVQRLLMSLNVFLENPISGNLFASNMAELGNHSTVLDLLGGMGIFALVFILIFYIALIRHFAAWTISPRVKPYLYTAIIAFTITGLINTVLSSFTMPVVMLLFPLGLDGENTSQVGSHI